MSHAPIPDLFTAAYIEAALFTTNDESDESGGVALADNYSVSDIDSGTLARMIADCQRFQEHPAWLAAVEAQITFEENGSDIRTNHKRCEWCLGESAGHDFWLTRVGHGAGFWDGDWETPHDTALTALSKSFAHVTLYLGDSGKIYSFGDHMSEVQAA